MVNQDKKDIKKKEKENNTTKVYDERSKKILANIDVVCALLKGCVKEYENLSKEEIKKCLDLEDDGLSIKTLPSEDIRQDRAKIEYDILFNVKLPKSKEKIGMYINVEAQNNLNTRYPMLNRAIYYASRLIARQKGETFNKSNYEKLKKVYSIWVCVSPLKEETDTIIKYSFKKDLLYGTLKKDNKHKRTEEYDFINIIMLNIGNNYNYLNPENKLLEMLSLLFKQTTLKDELLSDLLKTNYDIITLNNKEVEDMPTLSQAHFEMGKLEGLAEGKLEGETKATVANILKFLSSGMELNKIYSILEPNDKVKKLVEEKLKNAN